MSRWHNFSDTNCFKSCNNLHETDVLQDCCLTQFKMISNKELSPCNTVLNSDNFSTKVTLIESDFRHVFDTNDENSELFKQKIRLQKILVREYNTFIGKIVLEKLGKNRYLIYSFIPREFSTIPGDDVDIFGCRKTDYGMWTSILDNELDSLPHSLFSHRSNPAKDLLADCYE